jgi:hypothetical protein
MSPRMSSCSCRRHVAGGCGTADLMNVEAPSDPNSPIYKEDRARSIRTRSPRGSQI